MAYVEILYPKYYSKNSAQESLQIRNSNLSHNLYDE